LNLSVANLLSVGQSMEHSQGVKRAAAWLPLAAMALAAAAGCNKQVQHAPDVWAVVNGKEIKREEVDKYYRTRVNPEGQEPSQEESLSQKLNVLDELINNEILLEKAKKLNLEASDGEVEDKFTELKSPYTEDEFQRRLKDQAMTVEDLKLELRRQLSIQKLLNREVVAKIAITDQDVTEFYSANKAQFNVAEPQYHIAQILVTPRKEQQIRNRKNDDATNEAEAQRKVKMLMDRLNSGADFAQLDGLFRRLEHRGNGRRPGLRSGIGAESIRPGAEKGSGWIESRASEPTDSGSAERWPAHPDPEAHYPRIPRPARHRRTASAANHPRYAAQPQGTIAAARVSGERAGWVAGDELPGRAGHRSGGQITGCGENHHSATIKRALRTFPSEIPGFPIPRGM